MRIVFKLVIGVIFLSVYVISGICNPSSFLDTFFLFIPLYLILSGIMERLITKRDNRESKINLLRSFVRFVSLLCVLAIFSGLYFIHIGSVRGMGPILGSLFYLVLIPILEIEIIYRREVKSSSITR